MKDVNKTVKHCELCQENFGDRFSFCPVCGEPLKAVEVGQNEAFAAAPTRDNAQLQSEQIAASTAAPIIESAPQFVRQPTVASTNGASKFQDNQKVLPEEEKIVNPPAEINQPFVEEKSFQPPIEEVKNFQQPIEIVRKFKPPVTEQPIFKQPVVEESRVEEEPEIKQTAAAQTIAAQPFIAEPAFEQPVFARSIDKQPFIDEPEFEEASSFAGSAATANDGMYHLTMLQTPPAYRRYLGYGAMFGLFLLLTSGIAMFIVGIYSYNLDIGSADEAVVLYLPDDGAPVAEIKDPPKPKKKDAGGGGSGGNEDPKPPSKGVDAAQMRAEPVIRPSVTNHSADFELKQTPTTVGDKPKKEDGPYGIKSSNSIDPSDGPGRGGGQGKGIGGGQGEYGNGSGKDGGNGSGSGGGNGNGNGRGRGDGDASDAPPTPKVAAITERLNIISKPRANYTEEARKNQISGTVRVRVTFSASGQVTGVTAIGGLPYGLTEQAIAAARQIKFTPEKHGGQAVSVSKTIEYNFNLY